MNIWKTTALMLPFLTPAAWADGGFEADVLFLGEVHDNPAHHARQAEIVADVRPSAIVWEMLTEQGAEAVDPELLYDPVALGAALSWEDSGWPDFAMYAPIFAAAPDAAHFGAALPREEARRVMGEAVGEVFGPEAERFGLDQSLSDAEQGAREALQMAAHCDALPEDILPMMVDIQRLRDARLAAVALEAFQGTGGPVVVITGNGHARKDWGAPAALAIAAPDISIFALGQAETGRGAPDGDFDTLDSSPAVDRGDPCDAFRTE